MESVELPPQPPQPPPSSSIDFVDDQSKTQYTAANNDPNAADGSDDNLKKTDEIIYRAICEDNSEQALEIYTKYTQSLEQLDEVIAVENYVRKNSELKLSEAKQQEIKVTKENEENFDALLKLLKENGSTLRSSKNGLRLSKQELDLLIKRLINVRTSISKERIQLIETQDYVTEIDMKAQSLEDLGNGLRMIDFEQLRAEVQSLSDKIEERNNELTKLRLRCYSDTQILAHYREKEFMLKNLLRKNKLKFHNETELDLNAMRNYVGKLKLQRDQLRKQYFEMIDNCGLLNKPHLLRDYDKTINRIDAERLHINEIVEDTNRIEIKMNRILERMDKKDKQQKNNQNQNKLFHEHFQKTIDNIKNLSTAI